MESNTNEIRKYLKSYRKDTKKLTLKEKRAKGDPKKRYWGEQDSPLRLYYTDFYGIVPEKYSKTGLEGGGLKKYLEDFLETKKGHAIGLEVGGVGYNLFAGFSPKFFERTAGMSLTDSKVPDEKTKLTEDFLSQHTVIEGDMFKWEQKEKLKKWLNGRQADLIIERMVGGIYKHVPEFLGFQYKRLAELYRILAEDGIMLIELPRNLKYNDNPEDRAKFDEWIKHIKNISKDLIEIKLDKNHKAIALIKHTGAPTELPNLN